MIKAVIFDLDNTLYSYDRAHAAAYAALCRYGETALGLSAADFDALHSQASKLLTQRCGGGSAVHNRLLRYQVMLELAKLPIAPAPEMAACYWGTLLQAMQAEPDAGKTLERLRAMGLRVGVGTNMTADWQYAKLQKLELLRLVDFLVTSEEVSAEKPDPRLFALCAQKAEAPAWECAFVGDSLEKDAMAAASVGMHGIWYAPGAAEQAVPPGIRMVTALAQLPALLKGIPEGGKIYEARPTICQSAPRGNAGPHPGAAGDSGGRAE